MCDVNIADFHAVTPLRSASHNKKPRNAPPKKKYIKDYLEHLLIDDILRYVWHGSWALTGKHSQLRQKPRTTRPPHVALTSPMTTNKKEHNKKIYNSWWERILNCPELKKLCTISSIWKCLRCGCFFHRVGSTSNWWPTIYCHPQQMQWCNCAEALQRSTKHRFSKSASHQHNEAPQPWEFPTFRCVCWTPTTGWLPSEAGPPYRVFLVVRIPVFMGDFVRIPNPFSGPNRFLQMTKVWQSVMVSPYISLPPRDRTNLPSVGDNVSSRRVYTT